MVRRAEAGDAGDVAALIGAFRDWWDKSTPTDEQIAAVVARLLEDPQTEFFLVVHDVARAGCKRIELDVNEQNTTALRFYESLGFTTEPKPPGRTLFISRLL